jgi:DNA-binding beta-propeller fold protein YncE
MVARLSTLLLTLGLCAAAVGGQVIDLNEARAAEEFRWGVRSYHSGSFDEAILSLEKSLSYASEQGRTRLWLGNALYRAGFEEAALAEWRYLLDRQPGNAVLRELVQVVSYRRGLGRELEQKTPYVVAAEIDSSKRGGYPLRRPASVFVRPDGSAYVAAFGGNEIVVLDANGKVTRTLQGGLRGLDRPFACLELVVPGSDQPILAVSEYGANRVLLLSSSGERIREIGGKGTGPGQLLGPQYLATDGKGYLYVCDWGNSRVNKYDLEGHFILELGGRESYGRQGSSQEAFRLSGPSGIAIAPGNASSPGDVYVADRGRKRIELFDQSGNHLGSIGEGFLSGPEGLAFADADTLLACDGQRIVEYRLGSETWRTLIDLSAVAGRLIHLAPGANGELYVADFDKNKIFILTEMSALYTSLFVQVERVISTKFPEITLELSVEDRRGAPVVGLGAVNFVVSENSREVSDLQLIRSGSDAAPLELVLLIDKSEAMAEFSEELTAAVETLFAQAQAVEVVSAGAEPAVEAPFGSTRLQTVRAAVDSPRSLRWRLDRAARLAAAQLIPRTSRKAVIFLTAGQIAADSFAEYSLAEVTDYLNNNSIPFYTVHFHSEAARELEFVSRESGGNVRYYFAPEGVEGLVGEIRRRIDSHYYLKYTSRSNSDFGKRYIALEAEAFLQRRSGRTESGYFAPLSE